MSGYGKHPANGDGRRLITDYPADTIFSVIAREAHQILTKYRTNILGTMSVWSEDIRAFTEMGLKVEALSLLRYQTQITKAYINGYKYYRPADECRSFFMDCGDEHKNYVMADYFATRQNAKPVE